MASEALQTWRAESAAARMDVAIELISQAASMTRRTGIAARRTRFRPAHPDEAERLTAIAVAANTYWGYGEAFMARFAEVIALTPAEIRDNDVSVSCDDVELAFGLDLILDGLGPCEPAANELWSGARSKRPDLRRDRRLSAPIVGSAAQSTISPALDEDQ
jgi:hypothetical protein